MLWGGYTAKILISGTAKYEQYCNVTWFMGPTEAPCILCGVVSCLVTVETVNHFIFQICKIQVSCLTWLRALFSPLLLRLQKIAGDTDVDSLEAGRSWTQSPSFADRFGIAVLTCSSAQAGVRGRRSSTESGLCVNQQSSNVFCESELLWGFTPWMSTWVAASLLINRVGTAKHKAHTALQHHSNENRPWNFSSTLMFCFGFTHFWSLISIYSGLGSIWAQYLLVCLACSVTCL